MFVGEDPSRDKDLEVGNSGACGDSKDVKGRRVNKACESAGGDEISPIGDPRTRTQPSPSLHARRVAMRNADSAVPLCAC
jgi:hypothetical protein